MDDFHCTARVSSQQTKDQLRSVGFEDIREEVLKCYINPWSTDPYHREVSRWFNLGFSHGLEAMSLMPLIDQVGMTLKEVKDLCQKVKTESCVLAYHAYFNVYVRAPPHKIYLTGGHG